MTLTRKEYINLQDRDFISQRALQFLIMDTVKVSAAGTLSADIIMALDGENWLYRLNDWEIRREDRPARHGGCVRTFSAKRSDPFIYLYGTNNELQNATFHLPEILHGFNGIQIKSQAEVDGALDRAQRLIESVLNTSMRFGEFLRVDFAYNLPCDPAKILGALNGLRHPSIRKNRARYQDNAIQLTGTNFTLSVYPKNHRGNPRQALPKDRPIHPLDNHLRIEVQAKKPAAIRRLCGINEKIPVVSLKINELWAGYRRFLSLLPPKETTNDACTHLAAIALLQQNGIRHPSGMDVLDWWKRDKSPETIRKNLKKILAMRFEVSPLNIADLLPEKLPTEFLDIFADGTTKIVHAPSETTQDSGQTQ